MVEDLIKRITEQCAGRDRWYVMNEAEDGYCMDFGHQLDADRWMADRMRENPDYIKRNGYYIVKQRSFTPAEELANEAAARLTALESERDALLAAAGKEAVAYTTADRLKRIAERNRHVDTMWPASMRDKGDIPLFTAPQAQTALTDNVLMQAIADTAARGHVWASRALFNFRAAVREAAKSPDDA